MSPAAWWAQERLEEILTWLLYRLDPAQRERDGL